MFTQTDIQRIASIFNAALAIPTPFTNTDLQNLYELILFFVEQTGTLGDTLTKGDIMPQGKSIKSTDGNSEAIVNNGTSILKTRFGYIYIEDNNGVNLYFEDAVNNTGVTRLKFFEGIATLTATTSINLMVPTLTQNFKKIVSIAPSVITIASSATPTINTDLYEAVDVTALATNITSMSTNLSGTYNNFQKLTIRFKDNGTARTITWGALFANKGATLPTTTVVGKIITVGLIYNTTTSIWGCVAVATEV